MEQKQRKKNSFTTMVIATLLLVVITAIGGIVVFRLYMGSLKDIEDRARYDRYYAMIVNNRKDTFWQAVYQGAYETGLSENIYVELLGDNLSDNYSREDLMRIAISSGVDGIIVTADDSEELSGLIDEATREGIPVVTLYGDNPRSTRCSFVGIGSYNLGREYGRQVLQIASRKKNLKVAVLVSASAQDSAQNILCSGIQETLDMEKDSEMQIEMTLVSVDNTNTFAVEESIRDIFMEEELPDIIICLNELTTTCVYQAVVDYNKVGTVNILGYYDSDTILKGIDRNVIYATVSVDTMQMGQYCVDALSEYHALGYTSQYFTADITLISRRNVSHYLQKEEDDEK
ncbi:MAG: substrate-binding domain-containing protein [Lachnospiraceae bacterium]|nr:substrate-binding domain-containing protein [Lachnospiraceae bacterium]